MPVRFYKKPVIMAVSIALLVVLIIALFFFLYKNHTPQKEQYKSEKKQLSEIFATLDTAYWRNKDNGLFISDKAVNIAKKINDSNALAEALYNKARILQKFEINDSIFNINNQALAMAEKLHNDTLIVKIKNGIGHYYYYKDNYYLSMIYYTEAESIAAKIGNNYLIAKAANGLGLVYTEMYDYKRALEYYEKSINIYKKLANKAYTYDYCSALMNIGVCYMYKGDYTKATLYQNKALDKANQLHNMEMICKSYGNLGTIEQERGHNASALNYLLKNLDYSNQGNKYNKMNAITLHNLGSHYFFNKQYDKSEEFLNQSLSISQKMGFKSMEGGTFFVLSEVKKKQEQWQKAYEYHTRWQAINDSILSSDIKKKISDYQWEMKSQKKKYEEELLLKKYDIQKKRNLILIIAVVSIAVIALVVGRSLKKSVKFQKLQNTYLQEKMKTDEKINALEKLHYQSEIEAKNKELTTLSLQLVTKNEILTDISDATNKLYETKMIDEASFKNLNKIIKDSLNAGKDWEQFKSMFEKVHQDFFVKLKRLNSKLSENELRLCAYLKINLSNAEIARIFNINPGTLKINRHHIRKKLNLESKDSLEDYIREI